MKKLLLILFTLSCFFAEGQILQKDNTYGREMNRLAIDTLFGLPKDTFLVPASLQNIPFLANKSGSIYTWNISTLVWDLFSPGETTTASQGITKVGSDFQLGGSIASNRQIDWDFGTKKIMMNVTTGTGGDFYFEATDTVNNPDVSSDFNSGVLRSKKIYRFPAYSATTFRQGHRFITEYQIKDSAKINSFGGDFGMSVANDMQFARTSDYTGRSVFVIGNQTRDDNVPIHLSNLDWAAQTSTAGTNYKYVKGYVVGSQSYLVTRANDTLENWIGFNNMGFFPGGHVKTTYDFMGGYMGSGSASIVANPWGVFIWNARSKNFFAGPTGFGDSTIEASALIDASSTTKGVIWPRMTTVQKNAIASPATGLIVFDTDLVQYNFWDGDSWEAMGGGGSGTVNSGTQYRLGYYATTGTAISEAPAITGDRALISDANGVPTHSATTATEIGYVNGVTSAIQTQLDAKAIGSITQNWFDDDLTLNGVTTKINRADFFDDMLTSPSSSAGTSYMLELASGTGADASIGGTVVAPNGDGWAAMSSGTTTTGAASLASTSTSSSSGTKNKIDTTKTYRFETNVQIETLADGTDRFRFGAGLLASTTNTTGTNMIWFRYSDDVNSGNWTCYSADGTTTESTNSGVAAAAGTTVRLGFEYDNAQIRFYINGSLVATHSTRLPEHNSQSMFPVLNITKSLGTTNRNVFIDYVKYRRL